MLGNTASAFTPTSSLSYGSYLSAGGYQANPRTGWPVGSETNGLVNNQSLLEPCECQTLPGQTGTYSTNEWQHLPGTQYRGSDHQLFGYNPHTYYTLGDSSSFSPQTSLGFAHPTGTPLKAAPEDDDVDFMANFSVPSYDSSGSFSSTAASDMMTTMAHRDAELPWASAVRGGRLVPNGLPSMIDSAGPSPVEQTLSSPTPWRIPDVSSAAQNQTVSPKMLRLRPTPTPTSSSESIRTSFLDSGRGDAVPSQNDSQRASSVVIDTDLPFMSSTVMRPRRPLPDRATPRQEGETTRHHPHPPVNTSSTQQKNFSSRYEPYPKLGSTRSPPPLRPLSMLTPAPPKPPVHGYTPAAPVTYTDPDSEERKKKDEFLINAKQKGLTYKQIRKLGGFTEAESTLRGRYRTLTKSREARVRKPEWSEIDIYLLEKSVRSHATDPSFGFTKIPWKKVAEYIATNGGSYHFGNSTCRKKWDEYVQEQIAMGKDIRRPFYEQDEGSVYYKGGGGYLGGQF
ncbi:hypothetical protein QBC38DRAFT_373427 [Podospora fimiseda]|uniref:Myb-like domain-containing protein n=1 Tax=Podospora fimiseda TaxID=252190 RepID=A0AAN7GNR2_9PEZI|nr:hypothetical protein QBC38DRAFT_373427 [Podospora fimiseda]